MKPGKSRIANDARMTPDGLPAHGAAQHLESRRQPRVRYAGRGFGCLAVLALAEANSSSVVVIVQFTPVSGQTLTS